MHYVCYYCHGAGKIVDHDYGCEIEYCLDGREGPCPQCIGKGRPTVLVMPEGAAQMQVDVNAPIERKDDVG